MVDSDRIFCGRYPVFRGEQHIGYNVHEDGCAERGDGPVHQPPLSALDIEAALEPSRGYLQVEKMVDCHYAGLDDGGFHTAGFQHTAPFARDDCLRPDPVGTVYIHIASVHPHGIRLRDTRHCRRRLLYGGARPRPAIFLRGHQEHILQAFINFRAGSPGRDRGAD